ncbi:MAG: ferredoxin [Papillibacter sp.]|jgi:ferredoxin|nr:ferredoxin [Papillibacter sp.]
MKAFINRDGCISCGLCIATCPEVFQFASDGLAEVIVETVPKESEAAAIEAQEGCPVSVIEVK